MGRVLCESALLEAFRDRSRPKWGERVTHLDHAAVWRAAVVAVGRMGSAPCDEDVAAANAMGETLSAAAMVLAATLASPSQGAKIVAALSAIQVNGFLTTCVTRLSRGRLITVVV
jgi:hypothetical protein